MIHPIAAPQGTAVCTAQCDVTYRDLIYSAALWGASLFHIPHKTEGNKQVSRHLMCLPNYLETQRVVELRVAVALLAFVCFSIL